MKASFYAIKELPPQPHTDPLSGGRMRKAVLVSAVLVTTALAIVSHSTQPSTFALSSSHVFTRPHSLLPGLSWGVRRPLTANVGRPALPTQSRFGTARADALDAMQLRPPASVWRAIAGLSALGGLLFALLGLRRLWSALWFVGPQDCNAKAWGMLSSGACSGPPQGQRIAQEEELLLDDTCRVRVLREFLPLETADALLREVPVETEPALRVIGTRKSAVYFDECGVRYRFGGRYWTMGDDEAMPEAVRRVKEAVCEAVGLPFNGAVINVYDSPQAAIKWHDDGETSVGPVVASFSLGRAAVMGFRPKRKRRGKASPNDAVLLDVTHNTLVVMEEGVQEAWEHRIYKPVPAATDPDAPIAPRINLTFHVHVPLPDFERQRAQPPAQSCT